MSILGDVFAGAIIPFAHSSIPHGFLRCDGATLNADVDKIFVDLYQAIGTTWGGSGSSSFRIPDLRGEFLRGWDAGRGVDSGRGMASYQGMSYEAHRHESYNTNVRGASWWGMHDGDLDGSWVATGYDKTTVRLYDYLSFGTGSPGAGSETRPRNIAIHYCIKY